MWSMKFLEVKIVVQNLADNNMLGNVAVNEESVNYVLGAHTIVLITLERIMTSEGQFPF